MKSIGNSNRIKSRFLAAISRSSKREVGTSLRPDAGFSLVEVVLAIGIFSFCLIPLMGLIPVALKTSRDSIDRSIEVRMLQAVRANLVNTPYSSLAGGGLFVFDAEGGALDTNSQKEVRYHIFYINHTNTILPGAQSSGKLTTTLLTISNVVTAKIQTNSLHLPDNGF